MYFRVQCLSVTVSIATQTNNILDHGKTPIKFCPQCTHSSACLLPLDRELKWMILCPPYTTDEGLCVISNDNHVTGSTLGEDIFLTEPSLLSSESHTQPSLCLGMRQPPTLPGSSLSTRIHAGLCKESNKQKKNTINTYTSMLQVHSSHCFKEYTAAFVHDAAIHTFPEWVTRP